MTTTPDDPEHPLARRLRIERGIRSPVALRSRVLAAVDGALGEGAGPPMTGLTEWSGLAAAAALLLTIMAATGPTWPLSLPDHPPSESATGSHASPMTTAAWRHMPTEP
jgi:hypothetical protein